MARQTRFIARRIFLRQMGVVIELRSWHEIMRKTNRQNREACVDIAATIVFNFMAGHTASIGELLFGLRCGSLDRTLGRTLRALGYRPRRVRLVRSAPSISLFRHHSAAGIRVITDEVGFHDRHRFIGLSMR